MMNVHHLMSIPTDLSNQGSHNNAAHMVDAALQPIVLDENQYE